MSKKTFGTKEGFERPNHNDFKTSSELKAAKFSGVRSNRLTQEIEIWTLGDMRKSVPEGDTEAFEKAYEEVFALNEVESAKSKQVPSSN